MPVVEGTSIRTSVLAAAYEANGEDAEFVADLYDVPSEEVLNAYDFEQSYGLAA